MDEDNGDCAEILGCESIIWKMNGADFPKLERRNSGGLSAKLDKEKLELKIFPPLLTTLSDVNGRPRFSLKKVTGEDGRVRIDMVLNEKKDILRCLRNDGRLRMWFVAPDYDDDDRDHDCDYPTVDSESAN